MNSVFTKEHGAPIIFAEIAIRRALGGEPEVPPIPIRKVTKKQGSFQELGFLTSPAKAE